MPHIHAERTSNPTFYIPTIPFHNLFTSWLSFLFVAECVNSLHNRCARLWSVCLFNVTANLKHYFLFMHITYTGIWFWILTNLTVLKHLFHAIITSGKVYAPCIVLLQWLGVEISFFCIQNNRNKEVWRFSLTEFEWGDQSALFKTYVLHAPVSNFFYENLALF